MPRRVTEARANKVLNEHRARLMQRKGVIAVSVGQAMHNGRWDHKRPHAIRIYVSAKVPPEDLGPNQLLPKEIDGVPVDVVQAQIESLACEDLAGPNPKPINRVHNPLCSGLAIRAHLPGGGERGTLTGILFMKTQSPLVGEMTYYFALTAHHVLSQKRCTTNLAGLKLRQPGPSKRTIGAVPPSNGAFRDSKVDCGVVFIPAKTVDAFGVHGSIVGLGTISKKAAPLRSGLKVRKVGAKTGCTRGVVSSTSMPINFLCKVGNGTAVVRMKKQILVDPVSSSAGEQFADGGDSGALVVDGYNRPVGLLHGRLKLENDRASGIVTPLAFVMAKWPTLSLLRGAPA